MKAVGNRMRCTGQEQVMGDETLPTEHIKQKRMVDDEVQDRCLDGKTRGDMEKLAGTVMNG